MRNFLCISLCIGGISFCLFCLSVQAQLPTESTAPQTVIADIQPLPNAHAHNDYYHTRPLLDALDQGFTSIEADVFLIDGQLLVSHSLLEVRRDRTLESLYLQPLQDRIRRNHGKVYPNGPTLILLVDIKTNGKAAFASLHDLLGRYSDMISSAANGVFTEKAVTVVVSGDRPFDEIRASNPRYAGIDGRLSDLDSQDPADLMPLISDNWNNHFRFRGDGAMSQTERQKLQLFAEKVQSRGRRLRFWATPENETVWGELKNAKVDLIGTDNLSQLSSFLRK